MTSRTWNDGALGNTPIIAAQLNGIEADITTATNTANAAVKTVANTAPDGGGNVNPPNTATNLEAIPLYIYGNSYTVSPPLAGRATTGAEWPKRVQSRLRMGAIQSNGLSGGVMTQIYYNLNNNVDAGTPTRLWTTGADGLVVVEESINDTVTFGSLANAQVAYKDALRCIVDSVRAAVRNDATNAALTYTGTWTTGTAYLKNSGKKTSVVGAKVSFTNTSDEVTLYLMGYSTAGAGTVTVSQGATVLTTVDMSNRMSPYLAPGFVGSGIAVNIFPIRITGLGTTSSTITLTLASAGTLYFDGYSTPSATPPQVIFLKEGLITNYNPNGSDTIRQTFNTYMDTVAAEYPGIVSIADPGTAWDSSCLYLSDGTGNHPNDKGHDVLATAVVKAAAALGYKAGMNTLS